MPNVLNEFAGDGVTQTFNFSMTGGYLSRDYVYFFTRPNDDLLNYTPYNDDVTWLTDFSVRTANPIPVGTTFVILRSTTLDPLVDFQNTSRITEKNLDTATWQAVHIAAETSDTVGRIQVVATDAKRESSDALLNAQAAAADASTAAGSAVAASKAASAAQAAAVQAGADAGTAALSAQEAANTATAAELTAAAAAADAATAVNTANAATSATNSAVTTAAAAQSAASAAVSTANAANTTAGTAASDAASAVTAATNAVGVANTAMSVATEAKELVDEAVSGAVVSFNGRVGDVLPETGDYSKDMVGLGEVDNTSDMNKPVSTATATALSGKVDKVSGKQLSTEDFTSAEKSKLAGVADGANAYAHPATHPASIVEQDSSHRFVSDAEKAVWGAKQQQLVSGTNIKTLNGESILGSGNIVISGGELFDYSWHNGPRSSIDVGRVPTDGQQLLLLTHPDVCQAIWDGKQHAVDESVWQADPTKRNCWSRGDGTSWVRVPDLNAAVAGTGKPFYLRGGSDALNGTSVGDAIRNIVGRLPSASGNKRGSAGTPAGTGALRAFAEGTGNNAAVNEGTSYGFTFDASLAVPTADENRVKTAYGVMTVRVFTEVSNVGALDAGQLATQLAVVDANTGFTIIYPNGGTQASPANVAINSRYVLANPFPGFHVICVAELLIGGTWGETGWAYTGGGYGTKASQSSSEGIVVQTGGVALVGSANNSGGIFPSTVSAPTPCRVKVWKLKGGI